MNDLHDVVLEPDDKERWEQLTQAFVDKKLVSHILFLGRIKNEVRLYMIEVNPWKCDNNITKVLEDESEKDFNFARVFVVHAVPAIDFSGIVCSDIRKAEMLVKKSDAEGH